MLLKALASGLIMSLFPFAAISAPAGPSHADSLLRLLSKTHDAVGRERIYVQLADLSGDSLELAAPYWDAALAEAGREIHRPCGQHSSGTAPRPVPLVALRLLHLEADKRQQCGRNRKTRTRQTQDQNPQRTLARRAHRMGIPDGTLPRLLVAGDRSLRQHRQGDPLCGAGIEKTRSLSVGRASPHGADLPRRAFRTLHAQQRQTRRKADPAMYRTCTAHGWRWTTASNAPTATRRVT